MKREDVPATLTDKRLRVMRRDAEQASDGRWGAFGMSLLCDPSGGANADTADHLADFWTTDARNKRRTSDLDHVVNMQPWTATALIDEVLELREALRRVEDPTTGRETVHSVVRRALRMPPR